MSKIFNALLLALSVIFLSACAAIGPGELKLARAEPLFGGETDKCLDDPLFLIAVASPTKELAGLNPVCENLITQLHAYGFNGDLLAGNPQATGLNWRRNEVIDSLVAVSNRKCGRYSAHLKTYDGQTNSILSVLSILTGGVGGIITSEGASRTLAGASAAASGSRVALNDAWFSNQTIQVLVAGYEKSRQDQLRDMTNKQACPIDKYTLMDGFGDALQYHSSCSLVTGLSAAAQAIERSDQPGLDVMRRQLADLASIQTQANQLITGSFDTNPLEAQAQLEATTSARNALAAANADLVEATNERDRQLAAAANLLMASDPDAEGENAITREDALAEAATSPIVLAANQAVQNAQKARNDRTSELSTEQRKLIEVIKKVETETAEQRAKRMDLQPTSANVAVCPYTTSGR